MGHMQATEMAEHAPSLRVALEWHLTANHYPPVPRSMVDPCEAAIDAIVEDEPERMIDLPDGVIYRGATEAPAAAIAEQHHLDAFIANALAKGA